MLDVQNTEIHCIAKKITSGLIVPNSLTVEGNKTIRTREQNYVLTLSARNLY